MVRLQKTESVKDSGLGHRNVRKAAGTFGNRALSWRIEPRYTDKRVRQRPKLLGTVSTYNTQ